MTRNEQDIKYIIDNFDWEKVHRVMKFLNWRWGTATDGMVPSIGRLVLEGKRLLEELMASDKDVKSIETGGFVARRWDWEEDGESGVHYELEFVVEQWSTQL
jgi:hypothetical protein